MFTMTWRILGEGGKENDIHNYIVVLISLHTLSKFVTFLGHFFVLENMNANGKTFYSLVVRGWVKPSI